MYALRVTISITDCMILKQHCTQHMTARIALLFCIDLLWRCKNASHARTAWMIAINKLPKAMEPAQRHTKQGTGIKQR